MRIKRAIGLALHRLLVRLHLLKDPWTDSGETDDEAIPDDDQPRGSDDDWR